MEGPTSEPKHRSPLPSRRAFCYSGCRPFPQEAPMRRLALVFALAACASPRGSVALDPSVTPRPADPAPQAVLDARAHVVAVYVNETCDSLPEADDEKRGTGFWVNSTTVATAGHAMDVREQMFPSFAIVGPDGCMEGRYADWFEHVDLLFI